LCYEGERERERERERHREHKSKKKLSLNNAGGLYCIWVALWIIIGKREKRQSDRKTENLSPLKWCSVMILRIQDKEGQGSCFVG